MLIEGLLALIVFSIGLIGLLRLLAAALIDGANAHYRSEASLLASDLVARMWTGDRSLAGLTQRFGDASQPDYHAWLERVQATLPGASESAQQPQLHIDEHRGVTISLAWRVPGEASPHRFVIHTQITD